MRDTRRDTGQMTTEEREIVVLGLGNLLRRDEGLGIRVLHRLRDRYDFPASVRLVDGGTLGLELISHVEGADALLVLDAALTGGAPGTVLRIADEEVPAFFGVRMSHDVGLADLLAILKLRGSEPQKVVVLGMQPELIELGWELSPAVATRLDALEEAAAWELERWGVTLRELDAGEIQASGARDTRTQENEVEELVCTK